MSEREGRLPRWAQDALRCERARVESLTMENKALRDAVGESRVLRRDAGSICAMTPVVDTEYLFRVGDCDEVSVQIVQSETDGRPFLRVSAMHGCLIMTPQAANVVRVRTSIGGY